MASNEVDDWERVAPKEDDDWERIQPTTVQTEMGDEDPEAYATRLASEKFDQEKPGMAKSFALGAATGATRGWLDEGAAKALEFFGQGNYEDNRDRIRQMTGRAERQNPKMFGAGDLTGSIGSTAMMATPAGIPGLMAMAGAEGVTRSLGDSDRLDANAMRNAGVRGVQDASMTGLLSKLGPKAIEQMRKVSQPFADKARIYAGNQAVQAMKPTQKMLTDLERKGIKSDVGNWALDNKVVTPLASQRAMDERAFEATRGFANDTQPIYEKSRKATISNEDLKRAILSRAKELKKNPAEVKMGNKVGKFADDLDTSASVNAVGPSGPVESKYNPEQLRAIRQSLQQKIPWNKPNGRGANDELRKIVRENEMDLIGSINPELRAQNEGLFKNIRLGNEAEKITERGAAQADNNRTFGLLSNLKGGFAGAATAALTGSAQTGMIVGAGFTVGDEILKRYGNQWKAGVARKISQAASMDSYAPLFEKAMRRGPAAISALHSELMDSDPFYKEFVGEERDD